MSATDPIETLHRANALLERLARPEPEVEELLAKAAAAADELEAKWPDGRPDETADAMTRIAFQSTYNDLLMTRIELRQRGVDLETVWPALTVIEGGRDG